MQTTSKRGETYREALKEGLSEYDWRDVPVGVWRVRLNLKTWSQGPIPALVCCFTFLENGAKYRLSAYKGKPPDRRYAPRDRVIDFSEPGIEGRRYEIEVNLSRSGIPTWQSATLLEMPSDE